MEIIKKLEESERRRKEQEVKLIITFRGNNMKT